MSCFIRTRTPIQCRTHHQKVLKKYVSIANIILKLSEKLGIEDRETPYCSIAQENTRQRLRQGEIGMIQKENYRKRSLSEEQSEHDPSDNFFLSTYDLFDSFLMEDLRTPRSKRQASLEYISKYSMEG